MNVEKAILEQPDIDEDGLLKLFQCTIDELQEAISILIQKKKILKVEKNPYIGEGDCYIHVDLLTEESRVLFLSELS